MFWGACVRPQKLTVAPFNESKHISGLKFEAIIQILLYYVIIYYIYVDPNFLSNEISGSLDIAK
jgi:hypothetical protein